MIVDIKFKDKTGDYNGRFFVRGSKITVVEVTDEYGKICDFEDWTSSEQSAIKALARKRASQLEADDGETESDSEGRDDSVFDGDYRD